MRSMTGDRSSDPRSPTRRRDEDRVVEHPPGQNDAANAAEQSVCLEQSFDTRVPSISPTKTIGPSGFNTGSLSTMSSGLKFVVILCGTRCAGSIAEATLQS